MNQTEFKLLVSKNLWLLLLILGSIPTLVVCAIGGILWGLWQGVICGCVILQDAFRGFPPQ